MSSRFGDGGRVVPLKVALQLREQRDQLLEELQKTRRERDRMQAQMKSARLECEELEHSLAAVQKELEDTERQHQLDDEPPKKEEETKGDESEKVAALEQRVERLTEDLNRMRRRSTEELAGARREERVRLLSGLGEVFDAVERALAFSDDQGPWHQGLEAIRSQLLAFFRGEGASIVGEVGETVDPKIHQAIDKVESAQVESGKVARVDRLGIILEDGTVVRTAQVAVAA